MLWAIVPVKDLVRAKSRLAGILAPFERRALAQAMLEDVLSVLVDIDQIAGVLLVSDDPSAELLSHKYAIETVTESDLGCAGLNPVIAAATRLLRERGVSDVMVVHSDIPLLKAAEIESLLARFEQAETDLVLAPDLAGSGTNVMVFPAAAPPTFHYGVDSCELHLCSARELGLRAELLLCDGIGLDVDQPGDLLHLYHQLQSGQRGEYSARVLLDKDLAQRIAIIERSGLSTDMDSYDAI
jgi:2-phospho-L-lactate guanylyltransferase